MKQTLRFAKLLVAFLFLVFGLATIRHTSNMGNLMTDAVLIAVGLTILYIDWRTPKA
jgi:hypothetical protein